MKEIIKYVEGLEKAYALIDSDNGLSLRGRCSMVK